MFDFNQPSFFIPILSSYIKRLDLSICPRDYSSYRGIIWLSAFFDQEIPARYPSINRIDFLQGFAYAIKDSLGDICSKCKSYTQMLHKAPCKGCFATATELYSCFSQFKPQEELCRCCKAFKVEIHQGKTLVFLNNSGLFL